jgi:hypothetical protein
MFKLIMKTPSIEELRAIVEATQITMDETAEPACGAAQLLEMRAAAKRVPIAGEVMDYAMYLTMATHPDGAAAANASKKYVRYGASPRAAQTLIGTAKVRALMRGRYNVSYGDLNALAFPALRHRIKLNFEAVTDKVDPDDVIQMIIKEAASSPAFCKRNILAGVSARAGELAAAPDLPLEAASAGAGDAFPSETGGNGAGETGAVGNGKGGRKGRFFKKDERR